MNMNELAPPPIYEDTVTAIKPYIYLSPLLITLSIYHLSTVCCRVVVPPTYRRCIHIYVFTYDQHDERVRLLSHVLFLSIHTVVENNKGTCSLTQRRNKWFSSASCAATKNNSSRPSMAVFIPLRRPRQTKGVWRQFLHENTQLCDEERKNKKMRKLSSVWYMTCAPCYHGKKTPASTFSTHLSAFIQNMLHRQGVQDF